MEKLFNRAKAMLFAPDSEWPAIARETGDASIPLALYMAILALIPALAGFIGASLIGRYMPLLSGLVSAIVGYLLSFVAVFVVALIVDALAPTFGGQRNYSNALKLTIYSYTPMWLAGLFLLVPGLSFLTLLGLYGLYPLWLGLPVMMRAPRNKALFYALAVVLCALVIQIVIGFVLGAIFIGLR